MLSQDEAAAALARQSANSAGDPRADAVTVRRSAISAEIRSEAGGLQTEYADLETRHQAAIVAEGEPETRAAAPDAEQRERIEFRSKASLGRYLVNALRGRAAAGAEAELHGGPRRLARADRSRARAVCAAGSAVADTANKTTGPITAPPTAVVRVSCLESGYCGFDGSGSSDDLDANSQLSFFWDVCETTGTGETFSYQYQNAGTYTITLTVTDTSGQTGSDRMAINDRKRPKSPGKSPPVPGFTVNCAEGGIQ